MTKSVTSLTKSVTSPKRGGYKGGSRKGVPNKSTAIAREAIARLVDGNAVRMQEWLDLIAEQEGPLRAWQCLADVLEYHVPKLSRTEHAGEIQHKLSLHEVLKSLRG